MDNLFETAKRIFKRDGDHVTNYFRCTVGPKKGKMVSDPSKCGKRANPKRVRHGRIVAKTRGAIRVKKSMITLKTHTSKRIRELNARLNALFTTRAGVKESICSYALTLPICQAIYEVAEFNNIVDQLTINESVLQVILDMMDDYTNSVDDIVCEFFFQSGYDLLED